jgi:hypothetical protein
MVYQSLALIQKMHFLRRGIRQTPLLCECNEPVCPTTLSTENQNMHFAAARCQGTFIVLSEEIPKLDVDRVCMLLNAKMQQQHQSDFLPLTSHCEGRT